jgi:hypothetical protein
MMRRKLAELRLQGDCLTWSRECGNCDGDSLDSDSSSDTDPLQKVNRSERLRQWVR